MNCSRENEQPTDRRAPSRASSCPTPGKSSMIRCPSARRQRTASSERLVGRVDRRAAGCRTRGGRKLPANADCAADRALGRSGELLLHHPPSRSDLDLVEDSRGALVLARLLRSVALALRPDQRHLVVLRVEADVRARHVVEDEEDRRAFARRFSRGRGETGLTLVGREADEHLPVASAAPELGQDVDRRLELDRPRAGVLLALGSERASRAGSRRPRPPSRSRRRTRERAPPAARSAAVGASTTSRPAGSGDAPGSPRAGSPRRRAVAPRRRPRRPSGRSSGCRG